MARQGATCSLLPGRTNTKLERTVLRDSMVSYSDAGWMGLTDDPGLRFSDRCASIHGSMDPRLLCPFPSPVLGLRKASRHCRLRRTPWLLKFADAIVVGTITIVTRSYDHVFISGVWHRNNLLDRLSRLPTRLPRARLACFSRAPGSGEAQYDPSSTEASVIRFEGGS